MNEPKHDLVREPSYWLHKARALLLPTPLAVVDAGGEESRAERIHGWLSVALPDGSSWHPQPWFDTCRRDAQAIHLPDFGEGEPRPNPDDEIWLPPLLHPMSGDRPVGETDRVPHLAQLRAQYETWMGALLDERSAPTNSSAYNELWHAWLGTLEPRELLNHLPGHLHVRDHSIFAQRSVAAALAGARFGRDEAHPPTLLHVHCGPVQSFISAARRTSDLWLGSFVVNLLSYQAVRVVAQRCGPDSVIYPYLATLPLAQRDLHGGVGDRAAQKRWLSAAQPNRFVAVVDSANAHALAEEAAAAVFDRWQQMGEQVLRAIQARFKGERREALEDFQRQLSDHLEVDVAVQPWPEDANSIRAMLTAAQREPSEPAREHPGDYYAEVFALCRQTLTAQRQLQTFTCAVGSERRKCTQCGLREQLGPRARPKQDAWWKALREALRRGSAPNDHDPDKGTLDLRRGEALCAVCMTKRFAPRFDLANPGTTRFGLDWKRRQDRVLLRFPSVASVAAAPMRAVLRDHAGHEAVRGWVTELAALHERIDFEEPGNLLPGLGELGWGQKVLNPDGSWLYARSYESDTVARDHDMDEDKLGADFSAQVDGAARALRRMLRVLGDGDSSVRATPYYAVIIADVDDMGKWLEGTHECRPDLSAVLKRSGIIGPRIVEARQAHAALLDSPRRVSSALHAEVSRRQGELSSRTLHQIIEAEHLGRVVYSGGDDLLAFVPLHCLWSCLTRLHHAFRASEALGPKVEVSAGVAILDWRAPLSLALRTARTAEKRAKKQKGGCISLTLDVRSGAPIELEMPWPFAAKIPPAVEQLVDRRERERPPILRPAAVERMRAELETLSVAGLERAFRQRATKLLGKGAEPPPWFEELLLAREQRTGTLPYLGQVLDVLLLLRFLARERGGLPLWTRPAKEDTLP